MNSFVKDIWAHLNSNLRIFDNKSYIKVLTKCSKGIDFNMKFTHVGMKDVLIILDDIEMLIRNVVVSK